MKSPLPTVDKPTVQPAHEGPLRWLRPALLLLFFALPTMGALLTWIDVKRDGIGIVDALGGAAGVAVSVDGTHVYAVARDDHALTVFERDPTLGDLTFSVVHEDEVGGVFGLLGASAVTASPDGRHVYATAEFDDTLVVFARNATTGSLAFVAAEVKENNVGGVIGLDGASAVAVSADDEQVFTTGDVDDALVVFTRDASTDELSFVEAELNHSGGVMGLDGASAVAVSPDDLHVYVTGKIDDSLAVFVRQGDGTVDFSTHYEDDAGGVDGLNGACAVVVSPDGDHVYAVSNVDDAVATFSRDAVSGDLSFLEIDRDGVDGVDGMAGAAGIAVSPDGDRLFVAAQDDNAVAVFRRTPATGALDFLEAHTDGLDGVDGLGGAISLAVTPDALHVYVASRTENAVAGFKIALCQGDDATGDTDGDAFCDDVDVCAGDDLAGDSDGDGVCDDADACPGFDDNADGDGDGVPDGCDVCLGDDAAGDSDSDGACDDVDVCPGSDDNADGDGDSVPDGCDACLGDDATGDSDSDDVCDDVDVCPGSDDNVDADGDGVPDGCDFCLGNDAAGDSDSDGVCDDVDCAPDDGGSSSADTCGVCGGDNTSCLVFTDGFESGDTSSWNG